MTTSAVIITQGTRKAALSAAITSVENLSPPVDEIVVVWNGVEKADLRLEVPYRGLSTPDNIGIPAARNLGAETAQGDVLLFLDDDAVIKTKEIVSRLHECFQNGRLAAVGFKIVDPESGVTLRRWLPRPRSSVANGGPATRFPGGACAIRRKHLIEVGMLADHFFYGHEETDLAWRFLDRGLEVQFAPSIVVHHQATKTARHPEFARLSMRNHVWLARRRLPTSLAAIHAVAWLTISTLRSRKVADLLSTWSGFVEGVSGDCGPRQPMKWSTVWRLTRMGHPPLV